MFTRLIALLDLLRGFNVVSVVMQLFVPGMRNNITTKFSQYPFLVTQKIQLHTHSRLSTLPAWMLNAESISVCKSGFKTLLAKLLIIWSLGCFLYAKCPLVTWKCTLNMLSKVINGPCQCFAVECLYVVFWLNFTAALLYILHFTAVDV